MLASTSVAEGKLGRRPLNYTNSYKREIPIRELYRGHGLPTSIAYDEHTVKVYNIIKMSMLLQSKPLVIVK